MADVASAPMLDSMTARVLRQAAVAAQAGDVQQARRLAEGALLKGGEAVALNAFIGMLLARAGEPDEAGRCLKEAHRLRPTDATIACNLISVLIEAGDITGAFDVATAELAAMDSTLRLWRYRGFLAQSLERFTEAVEAYEHVVARAPSDFDSWNNLGNARLGLGDAAGSVAALQRAVELDRMAPPARLNLAAALRAAERGPEAETVLRTAADDFAEDARPLYELYVQLKAENRGEEAISALERALARKLDNADFQLKLGVEYGLVKRTADAERHFRQAIALDPGLADAYLGLVLQYEHSNREDQFAPLIGLGEANGLDAGVLNFLRALEHRRAGRFEEGVESLRHVPAEIEPERTVHIRATLLDRLGRTDEAFAAFEETNRLHEAGPTAPLRRASELRNELRTEIEALTPQWVSTWCDASDAWERPDPVFLVGFPRSGTTLLDTILMGHPRTVVMEEQPPLNHIDRALGGMLAIPSLSAADIAKARQDYFDQVDAIQLVEPSQLLIDKSPLFLQKVPLIQRLFPNARFILALRHPCDVVLSCFMSNFRLNTAMANFLRIEDAAEFYDLTFRHWERSLALFTVAPHTIVYERLIEDVAGEVRPLFDALELDWHEDALDHTRTAKARGLITTASYSQVTEPIYKRAAGRWQRYRKHLEPILPILETWVEKFGYSL